MREIKFRAWIKDYEDMVTVDFIDFIEGEITIIDYEGIQRIFTLSEVELMQYTGLKDKNGVEVYEGDILSTDLDRPYLIVEFRNGAFMFLCHDNGKDYYDFMATTGENSNFTKYHEVIGNIYENRKLLGRDGE